MWVMARAVALTTRLKRIEELAQDLALDLGRGASKNGPTIHREMADAIKREIEQVIRALSHSS